ncbi:MULTISPECIES: 4Fe-4S binding protein [unclassified Adlercreutzia]|uniref:4Fe-4S binding protein n=1 Tax=unclassified Adlercreutzia TaxID=2636013 RepID=UPI0013ECAF8B|nr:MULTISPECIES: 4Fe-4S binding protein [unclassified Adlercreutzia]
MGSFKLGGMTFGSLFKKPETLLYPVQTKEPYACQKGHVLNNVEECILCGMCQRVCPCNCIVVDKKIRRWVIDPFSCVQCGSCVRACPTKCLSMQPQCTPAGDAKYSIDLDVPDKKAAKQEQA